MKENETFRAFKKRMRKENLHLSGYNSIKKLKESYRDLITLDEKIGMNKRATLFIMRLKVRRMRWRHFKARIRNFRKFFKEFQNSIFTGKWYRYPCYVYAIWTHTTVIGWNINQLPYKIRKTPNWIREHIILKLMRCQGGYEDRCKKKAEYFLHDTDDNGHKWRGYYCYNCYQDIAEGYASRIYDF